MADKIKAGIPVRTTFVDGESPRANKLNSLSAQLQNASQRLEAVIGDIHSESYPYSSLTAVQLSAEYGRNNVGALTGAPTRALDIATVGRLIGPASNLNPHDLASQELVEDVPTGVHQFSLAYPPEDPTAVVLSDNTVYATLRANVTDLDASGDYYIDSYGRVFSVAASNGGTATYTYDPQEHYGGTTYLGASFNVIPDINQLEAGDGCAISAEDGNGRRTITLPTASSHHYNSDNSSVTLTAADTTYGQQLLLPKILVDNWSAEEEIPSGFLYLKNYTKNKVYKTATYYYDTSSTVLIGGEDITDDVDDGDTFCIVTVGTDITTSIEDLRRKSRHSHDRTFGEPLIPVEALDNILAEAGNSGVWAPSEIPGNYFPQYLHRDGYSAGTDDNVNDENIMRGDLVLGVVGAAAGGHRTATGASRRVRFHGSSSNPRPSFYRDSSNGFIADPDQGSALSVYLSPTTRGFRVRGGYFVPEGGMHSGEHTHPVGVIPLGLRLYNYNSGAGTGQTVDLTTYALDPATCRIVGLEVFAREAGDTTATYYPPNGGGTWDYSLGVTDYDHATPFIVDMNFTGANWATVTDWDLMIMVWYHKLVS